MTASPDTVPPPIVSERIPFRARVSILHQRIILFLRYLFRLPVDELRAAQRLNLDKQIAETLRSTAAVLNQLNARLSWYEARVPRIREEYRAFRDHEQRLMEKAAATQNYEAREQRRNGEQPKLVST